MTLVSCLGLVACKRAVDSLCFLIRSKMAASAAFCFSAWFSSFSVCSPSLVEGVVDSLRSWSFDTSPSRYSFGSGRRKDGVVAWCLLGMLRRYSERKSSEYVFFSWTADQDTIEESEPFLRCWHFVVTPAKLAVQFVFWTLVISGKMPARFGHRNHAEERDCKQQFCRHNWMVYLKVGLQTVRFGP